jgi:hypothetical protein
MNVAISGIYRRVVHMWTNVSEKRISSIFRVENHPSKKPASIRWLGWFSTLKMEVIRSPETSVHIWTTRHFILEECNIHGISVFRSRFLYQQEFDCQNRLMDSCKSKMSWDEIVISLFLCMGEPVFCGPYESFKPHVILHVIHIYKNVTPFVGRLLMIANLGK